MGADGRLKEDAAARLEPWRGKTITVLANRGKSGPKLGEELVRLGFPRVCVLAGGLSALRVQGLLVTEAAEPGSAAGSTSSIKH